jgi:predicted PurR-regulated permease PerM
VFAAYLLHDFDRITAGIRDLVPGRWRPFVVDVAREVDKVLGEFIRGQVLVMVILALLYSVAYGLLGVRLAILIGVVAGLLSFIPYVGGAVALGMAVVMCLLDWGGWGQFIGVIVAYAAIQVLEGFFITPRVVGDKVGLPAVWVLFALMVGGELFGFLGVLLALPAAAVVKIFVVRGVAYYRESEFFLRPEEDGPPGRREGVFSALLHAEGMPDDDDVRRSKTGARPAELDSEPESDSDSET